MTDIVARTVGTRARGFITTALIWAAVGAASNFATTWGLECWYAEAPRRPQGEQRSGALAWRHSVPSSWPTPQTHSVQWWWFEEAFQEDAWPADAQSAVQPGTLTHAGMSGWEAGYPFRSLGGWNAGEERNPPTLPWGSSQGEWIVRTPSGSQHRHAFSVVLPFRTSLSGRDSHSMRSCTDWQFGSCGTACERLGERCSVADLAARDDA